MAEKSKIQWTDATWNIARGCTKVDEDCKFCYMYRESLNETRFDPFTVKKTKTVFNLPLRIKKPSRIFTSSLTDVFHEGCDGFRDEMWDIIRRCPQHTFQILTKRPERIIDHLPADWGEGWGNVWLGTSIGSQKALPRVYQLLNVPTKVRFLSIEPLHERVSLNLDIGDLCDIHWAIIGGESGNDTGKYRYRPCKVEWIEELINDLAPTTAIFVKQLGTYLAKEMKLTDRHGGDIEEWPYKLRLREFPAVKHD